MDDSRDPSPTDVVLAELRATRAHVAQMEGRVLGDLASAVASIKTVTTGRQSQETERVASEAAATQFELSAKVKKLSRTQVIAWLVAAVLAGKEGTDLIVGRNVAEQVDVVATDAARQHSAAIDDVVKSTEKTTGSNTKRIDGLEDRMKGIDDKLADLLDKLTPPEPPPASKGKRR